MDHTSPELGNALMQWLNTFLPKPIQAWSNLADGSQIWKILGEIDGDYFHTRLPDVDGKGADNWIPRWQNWKIIEKEVTQFIREECGKLPQLSRIMDADLKAIATDASTKDIQKIVKCVLLAAMYSPKSNERMVGLMQSLGWKVAQPIATFFGEMEELNESAEVDYGETEPSSEVDYSSEGELPEKSSYKRDPDLEREEQLIRALQDKKKLEARLADALADLEESKEKCTSLEDELAESKYALDKRRGKSIDDKDLAQINQRADRDKEYIDELEAELANAKSTIDQQGRQLERFKTDVKSKQELKDELQLVIADRDELRQKSKANENLRKKIQTLQEQEKANQTLHHDMQMMQEQLQEVENLKDKCAALEKANEENAQTIANGEQEIFDQKTARRMLDHELKLISQKWEQSKELLVNAQDTIRDLEERVGESPQDDSQPDNFGTLDDELNAEAGAASNREVIRKPKQSVSATESVALQQSLSIANASVNRLQHRCLGLLQENLGFKAVVDNVKEEGPRKDLHPFEHQARRLEELVKELEASKSKCVNLLTQLTDIKQKTGHDVSKDAQERNKILENLEGELRDNRALLRHALLGTDALQRIEPRIRASDEYKLITEQLQRVQRATAAESIQVLKAIATTMTDRIESVRGSLTEKTNLLIDKSTECDDLQSRYESIKSNPPIPSKDDGIITDKTAKEQLDQLLRENKLMTSAWYDITCRLQSNTVHLARRAEGGRSWLGRMRTAVNRQGSKV